jgi:nucleotide-binding universal stress UspA family protein
MAPVIVLLGCGIVALGVVWYAVYARSRVVGGGLLREAIRPRPTELYRVVVPVANPETQRGLLRLAAASARANADVGTPELVAVNVHYVEHPSPLQNVEADRAEHQRELLENAHDIAEEIGVRLRTRAVIASNVGEAILDVVSEEAADELLLGWDGSLEDDGHTLGSVVDDVVENTPCDVAVVALRGEIGTPVGLVAPGPDAAAVVRRTVEFATVDGTVPTLLTVQPDEGNADADERGAELVREIAERAGVDPDEYTVEVVVDDDVRSAILETVGRYDTICAGLSRRTAESRLPVGFVVTDLGRRVPGTVALVRGTGSNDTAVGPSGQSEP